MAIYALGRNEIGNSLRYLNLAAKNSLSLEDIRIDNSKEAGRKVILETQPLLEQILENGVPYLNISEHNLQSMQNSSFSPMVLPHDGQNLSLLAMISQKEVFI